MAIQTSRQKLYEIKPKPFNCVTDIQRLAPAEKIICVNTGTYTIQIGGDLSGNIRIGNNNQIGD